MLTRSAEFDRLRLAVIGDRLGAAAQRFMGEAAVVVGLDIGWTELDRLREIFNRAVAVTLCCKARSRRRCWASPSSRWLRRSSCRAWPSLAPRKTEAYELSRPHPQIQSRPHSRSKNGVASLAYGKFRVEIRAVSVATAVLRRRQLGWATSDFIPTVLSG